MKGFVIVGLFAFALADSVVLVLGGKWVMRVADDVYTWSLGSAMLCCVLLVLIRNVDCMVRLLRPVGSCD